MKTIKSLAVLLMALWALTACTSDPEITGASGVDTLGNTTGEDRFTPVNIMDRCGVGGSKCAGRVTP